MAELKQRPGTRERPRSRSAKARLTPPGPETISLLADREAVVKEARERAKSAKIIRGKHTGSSKVFPARPSSRASKDRFTSMYSTDFDGSFTQPPELRPTSPTRRNNPHPAKVECAWYGGGGGAHLSTLLACSNLWCGGFPRGKLAGFPMRKDWNCLPSM